MIEIVFGESACGSLKIAQTYGKGKYRGSAVSIFMRHEDGSVPSSDEMKKAQLQAQEQERIAWENAIPLGGKSSDVYCFDMALSVGDISDNGIGEQRKNVLKKMLSVWFVEDLDYQVEEKIQKIKTTLSSVIERYVAGEEVRIWWYDTIVAFGELLSTTVVSEYLASAGVANHWVDMRRALVTQQRHKDASVDIDASAFRLLAEVEGAAETIFVGQGFIGGAPDGTTTTLGREGSDYSAAVVANILGAESMSVWKDVDGVLNADPKTFPDAEQIKELNYLDTIELAYSGAQIIHPKTIKPLQNKNIPLYVRPFGDKRKPGTVIRGTSAPVTVPILILKKDQVFLTVRSRDFSFVLEEKFATIFSLLERYRIKTNLIHNSAVNLGLCVDNSWHIDEAVAEFRDEGFDVMKVEDMELLTIRGYTDELLAKYGYTPKVFVRQTTQSTARIVRKK